MKNNYPSKLDINGPILSFTQQPQSIIVNNGSTANFIGIATVTFPVQIPINNVVNNGTINYRWYAEGYGQLSDGSFLGATLSGTGTTTLTISNATSPNTGRINFYLQVNHIPSTLTGNAINEPITSNTITLTVNPFITITRQPVSDTTAVGTIVLFSVEALLSDERFGPLSYQWELDGTIIGNEQFTSNNIITGAQTNAIYITPKPAINGVSNLRVSISNPNAQTVYSDNVSLTTVNPRNLLLFEGFDLQNNYTSKEVSLENGASFQLTDTTFGPAFNIITFYAPENDIDAEVEIRASKGSNTGSYSGGAGGYSKVRFTLRRNEEYTALGVSNNSGIFIYRGSTLIAAVGKGGDAGSVGDGGAGGGVSNAGSNGNGRNAGSGGVLVGSGQLSTNGIFGSNSSVLPQNILSGDSKAQIPSGGRTISCTKGSYWISQGKPICGSNGTTQFRNIDGALINLSALIDRGFKPGYTITVTEGKATATGGNGGSGATGGSGGAEGGGGGGSGYLGSISVMSSIPGENNTNKSTINFKLYVAPPPPPPPPPPAPSVSYSYSTPTYEGIAGGYNQNAGYSLSQIYTGGATGALGATAVQRALDEGYSLDSIQSWATRTGATIGDVAKSQYGLR